VDDLFRWLQQGMLFVHLIAFAVAIATVLHEDIALLSRPAHDPRRLARAARIVVRALVVLWATGVALLAWHPGLDLEALRAHPKLVAKLVVVVVLTVNGAALHLFAFPRLSRPPAAGGDRMTLPVVLGAISTTSWFTAAFIGAARIVAPVMGLGDYLLLYATAMVTAVIAGLVLFATRPRAVSLSPPRG
jgi:hypothetical protein